MPRLEPHSLALFSLVPYNPRARHVLIHESNGHLVSYLDVAGTILGLNIGHIRSTSDNSTLATIGRIGDVHVEGSSISRIQCSFEIEPSSKAIIFCDKSSNHSSQIFGVDKNILQFEYGCPRRVVVQPGTQAVIGMGGVKRDLVQFQLFWHVADLEMTEFVEHRNITNLEENPRFARTMDEAETVAPTQRQTRIHTSGPQRPRISYTEIGQVLGAGQFGQVYPVMDNGSGKCMALKVLNAPANTSPGWEKFFMRLKREVEVLSKINHPHIVDYYGLQDWDQPHPKIFMGLKEGSLEKLINNGGCSMSVWNLADTVLHHMLQALDHLATKGIVHRDIKPANILYITGNDGQYHFQLGDFGFCNQGIMAQSQVGTPIFMAPEMFEEGKQTHKLDIWSLYVTILWTLDIDGFREWSKKVENFREFQHAVSNISDRVLRLSRICHMGRINPEDRPSAAQLLVNLFGGVGLSTPKAAIRPF